MNRSKIDIPTSEEQAYLNKLFDDKKFDQYLLLGAGIIITLILWFFMERKSFAFVPAAAFFAGYLWLIRRYKSMQKNLNKISVMSNAMVEAKGGQFSTPHGHWIRVEGVKFYVNMYEYKEVSIGDRVEIRCVPEANILLELKKEGRYIVRKINLNKNQLQRSQKGSFFGKRKNA